MSNYYDCFLSFRAAGEVLARVVAEMPSTDEALALESPSCGGLRVELLPHVARYRFDSRYGPPLGWAWSKVDSYPEAHTDFIWDDIGGLDWAGRWCTKGPMNLVEDNVMALSSSRAKLSLFAEWYEEAGVPIDLQNLAAFFLGETPKRVQLPAPAVHLRPPGCVSEDHADFWEDVGSARTCVCCHPRSR